MESKHSKQKRVPYFHTLPDINIMMKDLSFTSRIIKEAVKHNKKIIIKHHNDADGIIGGYALEKSIKEYAKLNDYKPIIQRYIYSQPTYAYSEALRDYSNLNQGDLLILIDFASSKESLLSIKRILSKGIYVVVIDHHPIEYQIQDRFFIMLNPRKYKKEVGSSSGLISLSLTELIKSIRNKYLLALISMYGDKLYEEKSFKYMIEKIDETFEDIKKYTRVIDFEIFNSYNNDYGIVDFVLNPKNTKMVDEIYNYLVRLEQKVIEDAKKHYLNKGNLFVVNYEKFYFPGTYPPPGKITGLLFEMFKEKHGECVVVGLYGNNIIFRSNTSLSFEIFLDNVKRSFGDYEFEGGGHENAGSIRFPKNANITDKDLLDILVRINDKSNYNE